MTYCSDPIRLQHLLHQIRELLELIQERSRSDLDSNEFLSQILLHLESIGGAATGVSQDYQTAYPAIPWPQLLGFRHLRRQGAADKEMLWKLLSRDLPGLVPELESLILRLSAS